ncbi:hypothetical protein SAMN04488058_1328 [Deinococcus reticulitermitis]|uniref:Uncharacterized protein n=1 Tax=Deinococcus reticulitermitis TaxID=856736 RepID=A0A1H7CKE6_9DEIO|nr:hypothetical protein [Deinococcus reticulitermitis]SEJ90263.1 hypothetical protein SAMN04488058_1328 [Deinococcus reticulitermitis]
MKKPNFFPGEDRVRASLREAVHARHPGVFSEEEIAALAPVFFDRFLDDPLFRPFLAFDDASRDAGYNDAYDREGDIGQVYHRAYYALLSQIIALHEEVTRLKAALGEQPGGEA